LVLVTSTGAPPFAETRWMEAPLAWGENTMTSSRFHDPPQPAVTSHSDWAGPPLAATFFSLPCAKNGFLQNPTAVHFPSRSNRCLDPHPGLD
jgi:hypothetical protein